MGRLSSRYSRFNTLDNYVRPSKKYRAMHHDNVTKQEQSSNDTVAIDIVAPSIWHLKPEKNLRQ